MAEELNLGTLVYHIDADETAFNRKLDAAEARAKAFDARVNGPSGVASPLSAVPTATFGGVELMGGNAFYSASPKPNVEIRTPAMSRTMADELKITRDDAIAKYLAGRASLGLDRSVELGPGYSSISAALQGGADTQSLRMLRMAQVGGLSDYVAHAAAGRQPLATVGSRQIGFGSAVLANPLSVYGGLARRPYVGEEIGGGAAAAAGYDFEGEVVSSTRALPKRSSANGDAVAPAGAGGPLAIRGSTALSVPFSLRRNPYSDEFRESLVNHQWFTTRQQPRGESGRGRELGNLALRMVGYSVAGLHEFANLNRAGVEGNYERSVANGPSDIIDADVRQTQRQFSGVFASLGGLYLDGLGHGPSDTIFQLQSARRTMDTQLGLRQAERAAYFSNQLASAAARGDSIEQQRALIRGAYYSELEPLQTQIREAETRLNSKTIVPAQPGHTDYSGKYVTRTADIPEHEDFEVSGEARKTLQAQVATWKLRLNQIGDTANAGMAGVERELANRDFDARRLNAQSAGIAAGRYGLSLEQRLVIASKSLKAERDVDLEQIVKNGGTFDSVAAASGNWQARLDALSDSSAAAIRQRDIAYQGALNAANARTPIDEQRAALMSQIGANVSENGGLFTQQGFKQFTLGIAQLQQLQHRFDQQTGLVDIAQAGQSTALGYMLSRNPVGAQAAQIASSAMGEAQSLYNEKRPEQARAALMNGAASERLLRQSIADGFRAFQFDLRENAISPRDMDKGEGSKAIEDQLKLIVNMLQTFQIEK